MPLTAEEKAFYKAREKGLRELDIAWARTQLPDNGATDEEILHSLHKARWIRPECDRALRIESREWLIERDARFMGIPVKNFYSLPGDLPVMEEETTVH